MMSTFALFLVAAGVIGAGYNHERPEATGTDRVDPISAIQAAAKTDNGRTGESRAPVAQLTNAATVAADPRIAANIQRIFQADPGKTYTVTNLAVQQESLLRAAQQGDLVAARTLRRALKVCPGYLPRDERELSQLRNQIDDGSRSNFRLPDETPQSGHARLTALVESCGLLPAGLYDQEYELVAQLAQAGDPDARIEFLFIDSRIDGRSPNAAAMREAHPRLALNYLESELAAGNPLALRAMARSYRDGTLHRRDPIMAYAYNYAATLAPGDHRVLSETLPGQAAGLSAEQLASTQRLAREIYQRCCN